MTKSTGTAARVFLAYPLALPFVFTLLASAFPAYVGFDTEAGRVTITFTLAQLGAGLAGAYALIGGVFWKWGIKR